MHHSWEVERNVSKMLAFESVWRSERSLVFNLKTVKLVFVLVQTEPKQIGTLWFPDLKTCCPGTYCQLTLIMTLAWKTVYDI